MTSGSPDSPEVPEDFVLEATGIRVQFGGLTALSDVDISVPKNQIVGIIGPNGAGKSTLFGVISGVLTPRSGRIVFEGRDITRQTAYVRARRGIGRTFQHPELFPSLTIREHVVLSDRMHHRRGWIWSDLVSMRGFRRSDRAEDERVDSIMDLLGIAQLGDHRAVGLPLGISRLVEVARALATKPRLLLLDEPGAGLDQAESDQLAEVLRRISVPFAKQGPSLLLIEHDVSMVLGLSHLVHVLDFGQCIASGLPEEIQANEAVREAYLGDAVVEARRAL